MQRRGLVIFLLFFYNVCLFGQNVNDPERNKQWVLTVAFGKSSARLPNGYGEVYVGPPFWVGDLKVKEFYQNSLSFDISRERALKGTNILIETSAGFASLGFTVKYDYDYENSINNIVQTTRRFHYISIAKKAKYEFSLTENFSILPYAGMFLGYLIHSAEENTNYVQGGGYRTGQSNYLNNEKRWNFGYETGLSGRFKMFKQVFEIKPFFRDYFKSHHRDGHRRIFMFGIGASALISKK